MAHCRTKPVSLKTGSLDRRRSSSFICWPFVSIVEICTCPGDQSSCFVRDHVIYWIGPTTKETSLVVFLRNDRISKRYSTKLL